MVKSTYKNINSIVSKDLCLFCGMCYSICPVDAITIEGEIDKYPHANTNCINCGQCYKICPGILPLATSNKNHLIGEYVNCFVGYSFNQIIRKRAASGGIITSINKYVLRNLGYDGIICIRQSSSNIYENEVILAKSDEDILSSIGTRYSPTFLCRAFKDLPLEAGKKYIFIGKPCDIHALIKAKKIFKKYKLLIIALFCARTPLMKATHDIIKNYNINKSNIKAINYRGNGWPGFFSILSFKNNILFKAIYTEIWDNFLCKKEYLTKRCMLCNEATGEYADISVGDAWMTEYIGKSIGHSIIITRSKKGSDLITELKAKKIINIKEVTEKEVIQAQTSLLSKKIYYNIKMIAAKLLLEKVPQDKINITISLRELRILPRLLKFFIIKKLKNYVQD